MTPANEIDLDAPAPPLPPMRDGRSPFQKWVDGDGPPAMPHYVYVASSWRNTLQQGVVHTLRAFGLAVYDYRHPEPGNAGFNWREIDPAWQLWTPAAWRAALDHPVARKGFALDKGGMDRADCCVLVLPCGRSVFTLALEPVEPELMTLLLGPPGHVCVTMNELFDRLGCPR